MIRAIAWYLPDHYGVFTPAGPSWQKPAPTSTAEIQAIIDRPLKYFGRTTPEARAGLCAASIALRAAPPLESPNTEIGLISSSTDGCLRDNREYFHDYVASGRTLGRGNLFLYTLPTSVAGEIAIALELTGPSLFIHDDTAPLPALLRHAHRLLADKECHRILALWSAPQITLCLTIDLEQSEDRIAAAIQSLLPPEDLIRQFANT